LLWGCGIRYLRGHRGQDVGQTTLRFTEASLTLGRNATRNRKSASPAGITHAPSISIPAYGQSALARLHGQSAGIRESAILLSTFTSSILSARLRYEHNSTCMSAVIDTGSPSASYIARYPLMMARGQPRPATYG
jgi:hypothetical protein